jgi:hypothetical protein
MCDELTRLEGALSEAERGFNAARAVLHGRIGVSPKAEYDRLSADVDEAWAAVQQARERLDGHMRKHACKRASAQTPNTAN